MKKSDCLVNKLIFAISLRALKSLLFDDLEEVTRQVEGAEDVE